MEIGISPRVDYVFKWLYGCERNKALLIHFLNAAPPLPPDAEIIDVELINPFNPKETEEDKFSILDIKYRDQQRRKGNFDGWSFISLNRALSFKI